MFEPAHRTMPAVDYVSMIRSLYADRGSMLLGAFGSAIAAAASGLKAGSPVLGIIAVLFVIVGVLRNIDMRAFDAVTIADDDVETAYAWEIRSTIGAGAIALLYGVWCVVSFWVRDPFAELAAATVSVSVLVGVSQRNFAIDRLMTLQVLLIGVPLLLGVLFVGNIYYAVLVLLLLPFFASLRRIAGAARAMLLRAVHGRIEAAALATQLDTALDTLEHGLLMLEAEGIIEVTNDRALVAFGEGDHAAWVGRPFGELLDEAVAQGGLAGTARDRLMDLIASATGGKVLLGMKEGRYFEVTVSTRNRQTVLLFEDISERIVAEERINFMARYDALTGLPNRAYFSDQVEAALADRRRAGDRRGAALWIIDIDDFKHVNDTMGHLAGDQLLAEVAARLPPAFAPGTLCARLGGDEFIAFHAPAASGEDVRQDAERVLTAMRKSFEVMGHKLGANVSIGVVLSEDLEDDLDTLMIKADLALYTAKAGGKGQIVEFHESMDTEYRLRQRLKADLKQAIAEGGLHLVYQPIVDLRQNRVIGCEALARWNHPELGPIAPATFIPVAEETGLISDLTRFVLETATRDCRAWPGDISVAVNVSARDFRASDVEGMVNTALENSRLPARRLEIEVTETAVIEEREAVNAVLLSLYTRGIGVALDDFGTGYSSLSYLQALPLTKLKIDRSFVMDIETNPRSIRLLANVAQLGKDLDLVITAEGIETQEQLDLIMGKTRIDHVQGFLFGVPLPAADIARLIERHSAEPQEEARRLMTGRP
ncbi:putative bifunctional diguanylate cyclase/phosphodiesterase [Devosia geojensis]|uniref:putative bifunctional diguanylate cyclase/phosphodiesterase n=1 Tax=Devosia geojensis TaxID=443610 RepID=UPI0006986FFE|nr:EAL domain-containing protein [Devosia geojensis]